MPIYGYSCETCGHRFDKLQKVDASPPPCPQCHGHEVSRQLSFAHVRLRGNGWYETDFKSPGEPRRHLAKDSPPPKPKP